MKTKVIRGLIFSLLICICISIAGELIIDHFAEGRTVEETMDSAIYQLFPDNNTRFYESEYVDGIYIPTGNDPQMIWEVSHDVVLSDIMIRYGEPLSKDINIQIYYDDGSGFSEEHGFSVLAKAGDNNTPVMLPKGHYSFLRIDINGEAALKQIDCDATTVIKRNEAGIFQWKRCLLIALLLFAVCCIVIAYKQNVFWHDSIDSFKAMLISDLTWAFVASLALSSFLSVYYHLGQINSLESALNYILHPFLPAVALLFLALYGILYVSRKTNYHIGDWLYKNRWLIGGCVFIICVMLNLNYSSLHEWAGYLGSTDQNGIIFGQSRGIRSDEWAKAIGITKALSFENYPSFSTLIRATTTENSLIAGRIARDISAFFRPLNWGYLILGSASYGLSFNHIGAVVLLFLLSFDFFMLVCKNRKLSFAFACCFFFSPFVQWWESSCYEMFTSCFILLLSAYHYLTTTSVTKKIFCALLVIMFAGCFILIMYPAWQVPAAYFMLACLIWIIISNRQKIHLKLKADLPIIAGALVLLVLAGLLIYSRSASSIHDMINTVYPGSTRRNAPAVFSNIFKEYLNILSPYTYQYVPGANPCEAASFISFFPMGILLCCYAMIRDKKTDVFSIVMMILSGFFALFAFIPVPEVLRKITFMSFTMSSRVVPWFSFVQFVLFFRGVSLLKDQVKWYIALPVSVLFSGFVVYQLKNTGGITEGNMMLFGMALFVFLIVWFAFRSGKNENTCRWFALVMVIASLFSAGAVNPIQRGMAEVDNSDIVKKINRIAKEDPSGKWIVEGLGYPFGMVPLMGGAPTINCVNNYPNLELWYKMDPEKDDEFSYNRYVSQIGINLVQNEETTFSVGYVEDLMDLSLNVNDLKTMEVSYILTNKSLEGLSTEEVSFVLKDFSGMFRIYQVDYSTESR